MTRRNLEDLENLSMLELFRVEAENQTATLTSGLLELERSGPNPRQFETLMRAAHSLKGAARIINLQSAVQVSHAMEDCFVAAQRGSLQLGQPQVDVLLRGVDLLIKLCKAADSPEAGQSTADAAETAQYLTALKELTSQGPGSSPSDRPATAPPAASPVQVQSPRSSASAQSLPAKSEKSEQSPSAKTAALDSEPPQSPAPRKSETPERVVRLTAENLNRLLGLAGESLVESRWLRPFADSLQRLKRHHAELAQRLESLRNICSQEAVSERV